MCNIFFILLDKMAEKPTITLSIVTAVAVIVLIYSAVRFFIAEDKEDIVNYKPKDGSAATKFGNFLIGPVGSGFIGLVMLVAVPILYGCVTYVAKTQPAAPASFLRFRFI